MSDKNPQTIEIRCSRMIDGTGAPAVDNAVIIVEDGRITRVGVQDGGQTAGAAVIELPGCTVLPGFIDSHAHAGEDASREEPVMMQHRKPAPLRAVRGSVSLLNDLMSGTTAIRLLGDGCDGVDRILRDAIASGEIRGPRVLAAVLPVLPTHGTARDIGMLADGAEEVRKAVRKAISLGADVIKLFVSNICKGDTDLDYLMGDLTTVPAYSFDEIRAAAEQAHLCGVKAAAHCLGGKAMDDALRAGIDSLEHCNLMEESQIPLFLESGATLSDPNLILFFDNERGFRSSRNKTHKWEELPGWWREKVLFATKQTENVLSLAASRGVPFALGTDLNHGLLWKEAKYFAENLGAGNMKAIQAITVNGARICGIEQETGTVTAGKWADLVAVGGDPLADIDCLGDVRFVMKQGYVEKRPTS